LQASETVVEEAIAPQSDRMAIAVQLGSDLTVGRLVRLRRPEDEATAQDQSLGSCGGPGQPLELAPGVRGESDRASEGKRHLRHPCIWRSGIRKRAFRMQQTAAAVQDNQLLARDLQNGHLERVS
jgi:hypothetical protein